MTTPADLASLLALLAQPPSKRERPLTRDELALLLRHRAAAPRPVDTPPVARAPIDVPAPAPPTWVRRVSDAATREAEGRELEARTAERLMRDPLHLLELTPERRERYARRGGGRRID